VAEVINNGRQKAEGRRKKEEGRRKKEEGRRNHFGGCCNMNLD
jgi:hypothetical protein